jgi:hypothetical protein
LFLVFFHDALPDALGYVRSNDMKCINYYFGDDVVMQYFKAITDICLDKLKKAIVKLVGLLTVFKLGPPEFEIGVM